MSELSDDVDQHGRRIPFDSPEAQVGEGITGYWTAAHNSGRCSACFTSGGKRAEDTRILRLAFGYDVIRLCEACAVAMRELLIDALEDEVKCDD